MGQAIVILLGVVSKEDIASVREPLARHGFRGRLVAAGRISDIILTGQDMKCQLVFIHYMPGRRGHFSFESELREWTARLSRGVRHIVLADPSPEVTWFNTMETSSVRLCIHWESVDSAHVIDVARTLESAFLELGGELPPPSSRQVQKAGGSDPNALPNSVPERQNPDGIKIPCAECGRLLVAPGGAAGKQCKCPACGSVLTVPSSSEPIGGRS